MNRIKSAAAMLATVAGLLAIPAAASATSASASVRPDNAYTSSSMSRCFTAIYTAECVHFQAYTTYSSSQIWINGHVSCSGSSSPYPVDITWCGVGGGNGTAYLNIGLNWNVPAANAYGLYERMNIVAGGGGCTTYGTNSTVGHVGDWWNGSLICESPA